MTLSEASSPSVQGDEPWWASPRALWLSTPILLVLLVALIPLVAHRSGLAYPDEGVYAVQVKNLSEQQSWSVQRPAVGIPDVEDRNAVGPDVPLGDRYIAYARHAVFIVVLLPFYAAGGFAGMLVLCTLGTTLAALAAGLLARRIATRYGLVTMWLVGVGSPLLWDALLVAGHAVGAATAAWAVLAALVSVDDRRRVGLLGCLPLVALTVWLRSEGAIVMGALGLVLGAVGVVALARRRDGASAIAGVAVLATAAGAYRFDSWLAVRITGRAGSDNGSIERVLGEGTGPWGAAWSSLFRPWYQTVNAQTAIVMAVVASVAAALSLRVARGRGVPLAVALGVLAAAAAVVAQFGQLGLVTGLFAAFPLLGVGLIGLRRSDLARPTPLVLAGVCALSFVGLLLTVYETGGATEWGGRFFHLLVPLATPLVVAGAANLVVAAGGRERALLAGAAIVVTVSFSVWSLRVNHRSREVGGNLAAGVMSEVRVDRRGSRPLVVIGGTGLGGVGRVFWNETDRIDVLAGRSLGEAGFIVQRAVEAGYPGAFLVVDLGPEQVRGLIGVWLEGSDWTVRRVVPITGTRYTLYELGSP